MFIFSAVLIFCAVFMLFKGNKTAEAKEVEVPWNNCSVSGLTPSKAGDFLCSASDFRTSQKTYSVGSMPAYDTMVSRGLTDEKWINQSLSPFNTLQIRFGLPAQNDMMVAVYYEWKWEVYVPAHSTLQYAPYKSANIRFKVGVPVTYAYACVGYLGEKSASELNGFSSLTKFVAYEYSGGISQEIEELSLFDDGDVDRIELTNTCDTDKLITRYFGGYACYSAKALSYTDINDTYLVCTVGHSSIKKEIVAPVPETVSTEYDGEGKWLDNLSESWIDETYTATDEDDSKKSKYLEVKKIKYTDRDENETDLGTDTSNIKDAGKYEITLCMKNIRWEGGTTGEKKFTINVAPKTVTGFTPQVASGTYYEGTTVGNFPALSLPSGWELSGEIKWKADQILTETGQYNWTFTPDDKNYAVLTGSSQITVTKLKTSSISAVIENTADVFTSTPLSELISRLKVTKTRNNGTDGGIADASELEFVSGTKLAEGKNVKLTVQLKDDPTVTCEIEIPEIKAVVPVELTVEHDGSAVYTTTDEETLKTQLTVKLKNNDGSTGKTLSAGEYNFGESFALTDGAYILTVYKADDNTVTGTVNLTVQTSKVKSVVIKSVSVPEGAILWEGASANTIKQYLTVEVTFDDGYDTKKTLTANDNYTITVAGSEKNVLTAGECGFTVTYGDKKSGLKTVTVKAIEVTSLSVVYVQGGRIIYSSAKLEDLQTETYLTVNAEFNDGTGGILEPDQYTVSLPENLSSENNAVTVTWTKGELVKTATFVIAVTDVKPTAVSAQYTGNRLDAACTADDIKNGLSAVITYNDGSTENIGAADCTLEIAESELHNGGFLCAGNINVTIKYGNVVSDTFTVSVDRANYPGADKIMFEDKTVPLGTHSLVAENVPDGVTVKYVYNGGEEQSEPIEFSKVNENGYEITAIFKHINPNYKEIPSKTATLKIVAGEYKPEFKFEDISLQYNGEKQTVKATGEIPEWLSFKIYDENGNEFTGADEIGEYKLTVKFDKNPDYSDIADMQVTLTITKAKVKLPEYTGSYAYTGTAIKPKTEDFKGFNADIMKLESESGKNASKDGESYKATVTLTDTEHYEWESVSEAAAEVEWKIMPARISANKMAGRLPEFTSESYKGSFEDIVTYKYYTDETCKEEVHPEDLKEGETYYVVASLADSVNFELEEEAKFEYFEKGFSHTIKEAEEESNFLKDNWLYIVIGVGVLLLVIVLIVALTRHRAHEPYNDYYDDYDEDEDDEDEDDDEDYDDDDY